MAKNIVFSSKTFRETFTFGAKVQTWFPGHMYSGLMRMQAKLKQVDCIVEVHDARLPFTGRNPKFQTHLMLRPHILLLNKCDLIEDHWRERILDKMTASQQRSGINTATTPTSVSSSSSSSSSSSVNNVLFANCKTDQNDIVRKQLVPKILELVNDSPRYHREEAEDFNVMIIGIPNVGKSSLTNAIRNRYLRKKGRATKVGAVAGVTRSVLEKIKVHSSPDIFFRDTPGVMSPHIASTEQGLKLALCATLQDHLVGQEIIADYMLYKLNKGGHYQYIEHFGLAEPTDDIIKFLNQIAVDRNWTMRVKDEKGGLVVRPDLVRAAGAAIKAFREGHLGKVMLDEELL